jgi:DNA repair exonuclease SbcCD ATPase subunit
MAGKSTISITFKLDGDGKGFKDLAKDADGLKQVMTSVISEAEKLNTSAINFAAIATGIDQVQSSVQQLYSAFKGLTDAHAAQIEAETKLATNMRNTMSARDEDIQSIKDLCSAQQELGVIGDEVQLAGAQELATYLTQKSTLETLIPVLNDMVAQQYGLNATQESAAQIATMLGKVMDGQVNALSRYGYKFDEAQEKILKFGDESQRAATLAEVIESSVGGMNEALAQTDDGKLKQLENTLGDVKEQLGGLVQGAMPILTIAANTTIALSGVVKLVMGVKTATAAVSAWATKGKLLNIVLRLSGLNATKAAQATNILTASNRGAAASAIALKLAIRGLLVATGVGAAITALTMALEYFMNASDEAAQSTNKLLDANERAKRDAESAEELHKAETSALEGTRAALEINIATLKDFHGTKQQEKKIVDEMNSTYGETMGYFNSVADWYNALISNSEAYCRQMIIEARTRTLANQIAAKEQENYELTHNEDGSTKKYSKKRDTQRVITGTTIVGGDVVPTYETKEIAGTSDLEKANAAYSSNLKSIKALKTEMQGAIEDANKLTFAVRGSSTAPTTTTTKGGGSSSSAAKEKTRLQELNDLVNKAKDDYVSAGEEERTTIAQNIAAWNNEIDVIKQLQAEAERPAKLSSFDDIDKEISYQQMLRRGANDEQLAGIDKEIERLTALRKQRELAAHTPVATDQIETYEQLNTELEYYTQKLSTATATERTEIQKQINALNDLKSAWDDVLAELKTRLQELNDLVNKAKDDYVSAGEEERTTIAQNIAAWNNEIDVIKQLQAEAERPAKLSSFDDIDKEISYQQMLRRGANDEQLAGIDKEIERLTALRKQRELAAHTPVATDQIETYEQLNTELEYYTQKLSTATATERTEIQKQINALNDLKSAWDDVLAELKKPGDISTLNTIADLDDAISYYQQRQKKQSADEVQNTQKTIDALNAKRDALQRGIELPSMQKEIDEVNALTGHDYKVKIKGMGFDELTEKINALNRMLADTENPVTDDQRKDIERMISTYEQWRKTSVRTFDTFKTGYSGIKGMGDGVQSITDALEGNGNAWQKVTGIIDGFIQLYEGIQTVVAIINMLTAASAAHAATKGVEAGAETTEAGVREAATTANVGASAVQIAANKLETASWTELAAAEYMAAHAYIPFAGFGIAAGFTAAMEAMVIAAGIPMYADGGIAYGPTLGIFGEYAGASNNPEVVAPLDKLRNMLEPAGGIASGKVEFEIDGRVLRGVLKKVENLSNRS